MVELNTNAERLADEVRTLPGFKDFSLPGVKEQVADILSMIGREGIFSTYTRHDITHVEAMLKMLDWLIPPLTQDAMTPVDWLLTVLSIYLHDLGMLVTSEEYDRRMENQKFREFLDGIYNDPEGKDYLARIEKMDADEKERFFYQEFIRDNHAARIREWIKGPHSIQWGDAVKVIADEIQNLLDSLPTRFKTHLGNVCESHHLDNLDKIEFFPLCQYYGSDPGDKANVQYAALLLRTTDLLHVTKDRTPSVMYKLIHLSDPKGVDAWEKQRGTFSVHMGSSEFDPENIDTHQIVVSADFTEERPFFVLSEYLAYADEQIRQSKHWAEVSANTPDGKYYLFPWHTVSGDILVEGNEPVPLSFVLDKGRLLNLLVGHTIYNDPTVAVRELLQNAIDAVRYQYYLDKKEAASKEEPPIGKIQVKWDPEERTLIVEDNGIGMDRYIIENHLMLVGASFYDTKKFHDENPDFTPISRFGIGILTCFMVSDDVEIITCRGDGGYRIRMTSVHAKYLLKKLNLGSPELNGLAPHGTRVRIRIRSTVDLEKKGMLDIVRYWVILPSCEVWYSEAGKEQQLVGFGSPEEALHYFHFVEPQEKADSDSYEILKDSFNEDGEKYELVFGVRKAFLTPERSFSREIGKDAPAVCIEGIRVDNKLPGLRSDMHSICALLSVRGNKRFQTNVSRMHLERDAEYIQIAKLCIKLLFKHVENEVNRISEQEGRPLSKASSAARWVYSPLGGASSLSEVQDILKSLYRGLPRFVIEKLEDNVEGTSRELVSQTQLEDLDSFWTIESRMIDYLGIISRDLGRELSVNVFLRTLAPDFYNPHLNPVVLDAHQFVDEILLSHTVVKCEFSREHQQTLLNWKPLKRVPSITPNKDIINSRHMQFLCGNRIGVLSNRYGFDKYHLDIGFGRLESTIVAPIEGDIDTVFGIETRIVNVLKPESEPANVWALLRDTIAELSSNGTQSESLASLLVGSTLFSKACGYAKERHRGIFGDASEKRVYYNLWRDWVQTENDILEDLGIDKELPEVLADIMGGAENWFNASKYWRDWFR